MNTENNWQDQYLAELTQIMREADELFQKGGGSTRHYLRDAFLPMLQEKGFEIKKSDESGEIERLKAENEKKRLALVMARFALQTSYDVTEYPADGETSQDSAIKIIDEALNPTP